MASLTFQILKRESSEATFPLVNRTQAVAVARSWRGTPYVLTGRVKGAGCDCGTLLAEYLIEIGAVTREAVQELGFYGHDWFCHTTSERYLLRLMRHARKTAETICRSGPRNGLVAQPGNLALFRVVGSRIYNHGAIVTEWPRGIHASGSGVKEVNLVTESLTAFRDMDVFDPWAELERQ